MDDKEQAVGSNDLAITVEMGDDFQPGTRTAAALSELVQALNEEHGDDVSGFSNDLPDLRSFSFIAPGGGAVRSGFYEAWPQKWKVTVDNAKDPGQP